MPRGARRGARRGAWGCQTRGQLQGASRTGLNGVGLNVCLDVWGVPPPGIGDGLGWGGGVGAPMMLNRRRLGGGRLKVLGDQPSVSEEC